MAFKVGTVTCQCKNVMGMPTDTGECDVCGEKKTTWGEGSLGKLEAWAKEHSKQHEAVDTPTP